MRRIGVALAWLTLCAEASPSPVLERIPALPDFDMDDCTEHVQLAHGVEVCVVARSLLVRTPDATWTSREPLSDAALEFDLRALEARDVMDGPQQEAVVHFHDGRAGGKISHLVVCSVEGRAPRCTLPLAMTGTTLDAVFATRGRATMTDEYGAPVEVPLVLQ